MDPMQKFVAHFRAARYEGLSPEVIATVKITILDTMAAALAGSASEAGRGIARVARRHGGGPPGSTLVVHGGKIAPPWPPLATASWLDAWSSTAPTKVGVGTSACASFQLRSPSPRAPRRR